MSGPAVLTNEMIDRALAALTVLEIGGDSRAQEAEAVITIADCLEAARFALTTPDG